MPYYPDTYLCCDEVLEEDGLAAEEAAPTTGDKISQHSSVGALASSEADEICDESRCISRAVGEFMPGIGCLGKGPGQLQPYACSDGYIGVPANSKPISRRSSTNGKCSCIIPVARPPLRTRLTAAIAAGRILKK